MIGNIMDYLEWYGRFDFNVLPFNEVDNLILAEASYANLTGIVAEPSPDRLIKSATIGIQEAARLLSESGTLETSCKLEQNAGNLLIAMAASNRFGKSILSNYVDKHDFENQEQFSALHIKLPNDVLYVSFSGTDDTILGWKEDLNMAYLMPVPSQTEAVEYLEHTLRSGRTPVIVGGHSKGGNLAVYSSAKCSVRLRNRIIAIYNNDGPGFLNPIVEDDGYRAIKDRIHTIIPETSIIGMLLEHGDDYTVVKSNGKGILQHDGLNWQVYCDRFVSIDNRSADSFIIDTTISNWIMELDTEHRIKFVDAVYELLTKAGINYMSDLEHYSFATFNVMIKEMFDMDPKSTKMVRQIMKALIAEYGKNVVKGIKIPKWPQT